MKRKSAFFKDELTEVFFEQNGYAIIENFLDIAECESLLKLFDINCKNPPKEGMWFSSVHEDFFQAEALSKEIEIIIGEKVANFFTDYKVLIYTLANKTPHSGGFMHLHRDFTITDEELYQYRNVWIPLVDVDKKNGTLFLVPESHKKIDENRFSILDNHEDHKYDALLDDILVFNSPSGNALVYAERTIHGSFNNTTEFARPVVHFGLIHKQMPLLKSTLDKNNEIVMIESDLKGFFSN